MSPSKLIEEILNKLESWEKNYEYTLNFSGAIEIKDLIDIVKNALGKSMVEQKPILAIPFVEYKEMVFQGKRYYRISILTKGNRDSVGNAKLYSAFYIQIRVDGYDTKGDISVTIKNYTKKKDPEIKIPVLNEFYKKYYEKQVEDEYKMLKDNEKAVLVEIYNKLKEKIYPK
ncbi:NEQ474 [Nanoarchaeum equitans Kin4-M]|uniref:NEQ474 n=1 Tax=Nanoarchaeum equitans (strain Kin4-M) TaxID=228908 RepID=Q74N00_NANEQ|nr:NEQ474 [Nanoarchaeum equitans Kin4-M]